MMILYLFLLLLVSLLGVDSLLNSISRVNAKWRPSLRNSAAVALLQFFPQERYRPYSTSYGGKRRDEIDVISSINGGPKSEAQKLFDSKGLSILLRDIEFCVVDTEGRNYIVEVAGCIFSLKNGITGLIDEVIGPERFESIRYPLRFKKTDIEDTIPFSEVSRDVQKMFENRVLVGHNLKHDLSMFQKSSEIVGSAWKRVNLELCTYKLAKRLLHSGVVPNYKLSTLAEYYGCDKWLTHRALGDVIATTCVLAGLLKDAESCALCKSLDDLHEYLKLSPKECRTSRRCILPGSDRKIDTGMSSVITTYSRKGLKALAKEFAESYFDNLSDSKYSPAA